MHDIVARLRRDAGQLTLAQLMQEREAAACEIERLRNQQNRSHPMTASPRNARVVQPPAPKHSPDERQPLQLGALVRLSEVCKLVSLSRSSIYSRVADGSFPPPVKLSDHCVRWRREDLEAWIQNLPAQKLRSPSR
jgi:prophage regulatory protein